MRSAADDTTARARIRDAAIANFGRDGFGVGLRTIAADAGVSAALVLHHFGSKEGLRAACDEHVARTIRDAKAEGLRAGEAAPAQIVGRLATMADYQPLVGYLLRALQEGSPATDALFDHMVADAQDYLQAGVASGVLTATGDPRMRALVLTLMAFGPLLLGRHLGRHLGTDGYTMAAQQALIVPMLELLTPGLFADAGLLEVMRTLPAAHLDPATEPTPDPTPARERAPGRSQQ